MIFVSCIFQYFFSIKPIIIHFYTLQKTNNALFSLYFLSCFYIYSFHIFFMLLFLYLSTFYTYCLHFLLKHLYLRYNIQQLLLYHHNYNTYFLLFQQFLSIKSIITHFHVNKKINHNKSFSANS